MQKANLLSRDLKTKEQDLKGKDIFLVTRFTTKGFFLTTLSGFDSWEGEWYPKNRVILID